jgi:chemotaxis response regulator CheB
MSKRKILIVDDIELIRKTLGEMVNADPMLEVCGYANDGAEAVKAAAAQDPDLVLLDLEMPEWDGMGFLRHYRHQTRGKVIVLSGKVGGALKPIGDAAIREGADAVISKSGTGGTGGNPDDSTQREIIATIYELLEIEN